MSEYTPTEGQMLTAWLIASGASRMHGTRRERAHAGFDRFLTKIRADAWDDGYEGAARYHDLDTEHAAPNPYRRGER